MQRLLRILVAVLSVCLIALLLIPKPEGPQLQSPSTQPPAPTQTAPSDIAPTMPPQTTPPTTEPDYEAIIGLLQPQIPAEEGIDLHWVKDTFGGEAVLALEKALAQGYHRDVWYQATGNTWQTLRKLAVGKEFHLISLGAPGQQNETTSLIFGGDICLADNYLTMQHLASTGGTIEDGIDPKLIEIMQQADVAFLNNEFTISDRGEPMKDKYYTFRAAVKNTAIYQQLGIDIVSLANNHAYDFGKTAFLDTLDALDSYGIAQVGGGRNLEEAMKAQYYVVNGRVIAFVAASRAEKFKMTPAAKVNSPGILWCYETELFVQAIQEAKANSDYVVALVHWGMEYTPETQDYQTATSREYLDAGADAIIGAHVHQLQGIEYYEGKPIFYNLGNFWFNSYEIETGLAEINIAHDGTVSCRFIPALQKDCVTTYQMGTERGALILENLRPYCVNVELGEDGTIREVA